MRFRLCNLTLILVFLVAAGNPALLRAAAPPRQGAGRLCDGLLPEPLPGLAKPWDIYTNKADVCAAGQ